MLCRRRHNIHLIRNTFRLTSRKYWDEIKRDIKPIYTAVNAAAARVAFDELTQKWGQRYPAVIRLWDNAWSEFIPFLDYDVEIRQVICSTNAIVIWSSSCGVLDVRHAALRSLVLRGGRGYLQSSRKQSSAEGRCKLHGSSRRSRRVSRGPFSATTTLRSSRLTGIWRICLTSNARRTRSRPTRTT